MIELVDQHIKTRLEIIQFEGEAIRVYEYDPERGHGETEHPCIAFVRSEIVVGSDQARPDSYLYTASTEQTEITVPLNMGGGSLTGPVSYTRKPYPVPVDITYEIQARATNRSHAIKLVESIYAVFPQGYMPQIGSQFPLFIHTEHICLDDLSKPLFINAFLLNVYDLWIDRFEIETHQSIRTIYFEDESQFDGIGG